MQKKRYTVRSAVQGLASLVVLYNILYGEETRLPVEWFSVTPNNFLTSSVVFLACMIVLFFIEGTKAADYGRDRNRSPLLKPLGWYASYWKICVPLTGMGFLLFTTKYKSAIYTAMYRKFDLKTTIASFFAISNGLHEGAWLIVTLVILSYSAACYFHVDSEKRRRDGLLTLLLGVAVVAALNLQLLLKV